VNALRITDTQISCLNLPLFVFLHEWCVHHRLFTPTLTGNLNEYPIIFKRCNFQNLNDTFYNVLFTRLTQHIPKTIIENLEFCFKENYMVFV
jgi:hypothetical protein